VLATPPVGVASLGHRTDAGECENMGALLPRPAMPDVRATLLTNIPTPYRAPLYARVHDALQAGGGSFTVVYGAMHQAGRQWSDAEPPTGAAPFVVARGAQLRLRGRVTYVNPAVARTVALTRPEVVVISGYAPWTYSVASWCLATRTPFVLWSGETIASEEHLSGRHRVRRWPLLRSARQLLAYGPAARDYMLATGVADERITVLGNGIDVDAFAARIEPFRPEREQMRARFGLTGPTILSVGGKNLGFTLEAAEALPDPAQVLVVGPEPCDPHHPRIVTIGRRRSDEMPGIYAMSDCLAHVPVVDRWPHAINEALSAGLPVVSSPDTGVPDEVLTGPGCARVPRRVEAVASALQRALRVGAESDADVREQIRAPLRPWGVVRMAERFAATLRSARAT
jgi:glycosyltransferase involved in cell wall biosynthesis